MTQCSKISICNFLSFFKIDYPNFPNSASYENEILSLYWCTVPPPDIGYRVAVGRPRTYRDRDHDHDHYTSTAIKSVLGFNAVYLINSNRGNAVGAVQIRGRQTDITKCRNVSIMQLKRFPFLEFLIYGKLTSKLTC